MGFFEWLSDNGKELEEKYPGFDYTSDDYFEYLEREYKNQEWALADYILDREK